MKKIASLLGLCSSLFFLNCATTKPFANSEKSNRDWEEIFQCIQTAPPGKSCGSAFKSHSFTAKVSSIQKDKLGQTQVVSRFGAGDKAFTCESTRGEGDSLNAGDIIEFEGTVSGVTVKPMQRAVEFKDCTIRKL